MEHRPKVGLDSPGLRGRLRTPTRRSYVHGRPVARPTPRTEHVAPPAALTDEALEKSLHNLGKPTKASITQRPDLPRQSRSHVLKRTAVAKASKKYRPKKYRRPIMPTLITVLTVLLFGFGAFTTALTFKNKPTNHTAVKGATAQPDTKTNDGLPSEEEVSDVLNAYTVPATLPKILTIDRLQIHARILPTSAGAGGQPAAPDNIFDVGWYEGGSKPGEQGTAILNGHVAGPTKPGVFHGLSNLKPGDTVTITRGDGKVMKYTVQDVKTVANDKIDIVKLTQPEGKSAVNIITSAGRFNIRTNQYEPRVVVFAVQDI